MHMLLDIAESSVATHNNSTASENASRGWFSGFEDGFWESFAEAACAAGVFAVVWGFGARLSIRRTPVPSVAAMRVKQGRAVHNAIDAECNQLAMMVKQPTLATEDRLQLIHDAHDRLSSGAEPVCSSEECLSRLLSACLRSCTSVRNFSEALVLHDQFASRFGDGNPSLWSLLLWSCVEEGDLDRFQLVFKKICANGAPNAHDFINLVRYGLQAGEERFLRLYATTQPTFNREVQLPTRNRALSMCASAGAMTMAQAIVEGVDMKLDIVAHNMLMKGYANVRDLHHCFETYAQLKRSGVEPTQITFGILMDACIDANQLEAARQIFGDVKAAGLEFNAVLCTTFIKGLVNAGELKEAMDVLDDMSACPNTKPDLITFATLIKAHAGAGNVRESVSLLDRTIKAGITPDLSTYNTVLSGCCVKPVEPAQVMRVGSELVLLGLQPNTATLSLLMKAFAMAEAWPEALEVLKNANTRWGVWPEARIYGQLALACAQTRDDHYALLIYAAMVKSCCERGYLPSKAANNRLHRLCSTCGAGPVATRIHQAVLDSSEEGLDVQSLGELMDVIARKLSDGEQL